MMTATPNESINTLNNNNNNNKNGQTVKNTNGNEVTSKKNPQVTLQQNSVEPKSLIPELCNHFYHLGWASGTGGGLSIRQDGLIYCAPSGVQKERIQGEDMFVLDEKTLEIIERPADEKLKISECLSLFMVAFKHRSAGCCIHSHSINANLITALHSKQYLHSKQQQGNNNNGSKNGGPNKQYSEFRMSHQEMIKGIRLGSSEKYLNYNDTLVVPIIDNVLFERDLAGSMQQAVLDYPDANAVLVRNHGVYVWGQTWQQAKSMAECYDYLFKLKLEAVRLGFDWMLDD